MRHGVALLFTAVACAAWTQTAPSGLSPFSSIRPDLVIDVKPAPNTTAQLVEITMRDENYPTKLLESQVNSLCALLGSTARGLSVGKSAMEGTQIEFVRAKFATDGLVLEQGKVLQIQPILKAFAGTPAPNTIKGFDIAFEEVAPTKTMIESYTLPGVLRSEARYIPDPATIEYRIELLTQEPSKIVFPNTSSDIPVTQAPPPALKPSSNWPVILLFTVAGLGLAALVYLTILRWGLRTPSRKAPKL